MADRRTVSYHEIAKRAGVSVATVSHVIYGTRYVSPELTARVREAIEELNYTPNILARSFRRRATHTIGIIASELTNPFYAEIAVAAETLLMDEGYMTLICNSFNDVKKEQAYIRALLGRRVDGLILTSARFEGDAARILSEQQIPFVLVNRRCGEIASDYVGVDNIGGMRAVVEHVIGLGHSRIAFVGGFPYSSVARDRYTGYLEALKAHGIEPEAELFFEGKYDIDSGAEAAKYLLSLPGGQRPTAICAANDLLALGVIDWAMRAHLRVPENVSVTGFDDLQLSGLAPINLTTVRQSRAEMGRAAAELVLKRIRGELPDEPQVIILPCNLVVRNTTGRSPG